MVGVAKKRKPDRSYLHEAKLSLSNILDRLRMQLPFPVKTLPFYSGCFPIPFVQLLAKGDEPELSIKNFMSLLNLGNTMSFVLDVDDGSCVFYFESEYQLPSPTNGTSIRIPRKHPHFDKLNRWYANAVLVEEEIEGYKQGIAEYCEEVGHLQGVQATWPELAAYTRIRNRDLGSGVSYNSMQQAKHNAARSEVRKDLIIAALAKGSLIDKYVVKAWPVFNAVREGDLID